MANEAMWNELETNDIHGGWDHFEWEYTEEITLMISIFIAESDVSSADVDGPAFDLTDPDAWIWLVD